MRVAAITLVYRNSESGIDVIQRLIEIGYHTDCMEEIIKMRELVKEQGGSFITGALNKMEV